MNCDEATLLLERYVDGELSSEERKRFEAHSSRCEVCQSEMALLGSVNELARRESKSLPLPDERYWQSFPDRVMSRIGGTSIETPKRPSERQTSFLASPWMTWGALAACLVIAVTVGFHALRDGQLEAPLSEARLPDSRVPERTASPSDGVPSAEQSAEGDPESLESAPSSPSAGAAAPSAAELELEPGPTEGELEGRSDAGALRAQTLTAFPRDALRDEVTGTEDLEAPKATDAPTPTPEPTPLALAPLEEEVPAEGATIRRQRLSAPPRPESWSVDEDPKEQEPVTIAAKAGSVAETESGERELAATVEGASSTSAASDARLEQAEAARLLGRHARAGREDRAANRGSAAETSPPPESQPRQEATAGTAGRTSSVLPDTAAVESLRRSQQYGNEYRRISETPPTETEPECERWRDFLRRYPEGEHTADARYQLALCSVRRFEGSSGEADRDRALTDIGSFLELEDGSERARELSKVRERLRDAKR